MTIISLEFSGYAFRTGYVFFFIPVIGVQVLSKRKLNLIMIDFVK